ncbi:STAS domain-containing protein [Streptomyces sp. NPDC088785]|uniref:STAS domain-containing protein n=1 Tax=Streptomyces sp. NPDC088785 TaxID=3365897 RepID=UPI003807A82A
MPAYHDTEAAFGMRVPHAEDPRVVELWGELDILAAHRLADRLRDLFPGEGGTLVADLRGVTFLDCSGLSMFVRVQERLRARQARLILVLTDPFLLRVVRLAGLADALRVAPDLDTALAWPARDVPA